MGRKKFTIWLDESTAESFRKRAISEGLTLSETGAHLVAIALGGGDSVTSGSSASSGFDPEPVRKAVETAIQASDLGTLKAEIRALERTLFEGQGMKPADVPAAGYIWTKDQAAFLVYTVACINRFFEEYNAAWNTNDQQKVMTRTRLANDSGTRAVRKYFPEGEESRKEQREKQEDGEKR